ncbi:MAG: hypothetical protein K2L70_03850, partial [Clostridia bacterium]|nr:hypothetical protein [Clostridia bacterium]
MEKKNYTKKTLAVLTIAIVVLMALSCVFGIFGNLANFKEYVRENDNDNFTTPLSRPTISTAGDLSRFANGVKYVFTDKSKVDGFRNGTEEFDITSVVVNATDTLGTQTNPHVITSIDEWEIFVKQMAADSTNGTGQYYVLANDLDFDGVDFHPVVNFSGTFYGLGYSFKNITCSTWQYWNTSTNAYVNIGTSNVALGGFGIFCKIANATITDLIVQNYSYPNVSLGYQAINNHGPYIGAIIGISYGNDNVFNCHSSGEISSTISYSTYPVYGGIVGMQGSTQGGNKDFTLLMYRCSSELNSSAKVTASNRGPVGGGILGYNRGGTIIIYDCASNVKLEYTATYDYFSACMPRSWGVAVLIENFVGTIDVTSSSASWAGALTGTSQNNVTAKNIYVDGKRGATADTKNSMYPISGEQSLTLAQISNINTVMSTASHASIVSGCKDALPKDSYMEYGNSDIMIAAAKNNVGTGLLSQIWDKDKIGGAYDPDNSPVRNYLVATVTFKNLLSGDNKEDVGLSVDDYMKDDPLPTPSNEYPDFKSYADAKTNHVFKGWVMIDDKGAATTEPFTSLPSGVFGDVTLYAVWGLSDDYVKDNIKTSLTSDKDKIEYDSVESITLTALVEHTSTTGGMTDAKPTYYFIQDGTEKTTAASVKNSGVLSVKTVADSGEYTFNYRITDSNEPLWYYDGKHTTGKSIEIEKGKLTSMTLNDFKIDEATIPHYGKPLSEIDFTCTVKNKANVNVEIAEANWERDIFTVVKGANKFNIVIKPTDTDNYEASYTFEVEFQSKALQIVFNIHQFSDEKLTHDIEYGKSISSGTVIAYFEEVYLDAMNNKWDEATVNFLLNSSYAPYLNGAPITPDSGNSAIFSENYTNVKEELTIEVTFEKAVYNITYLDSNGGII